MRSANGLAAAALVAVVLASPAARADRKQVCVEAYGNAQRLQRDRKLRAAHAQLVICVSDDCPAAIRPECVKWLTDVEAAQPSIVVSAKDERGEETTQVSVTIDGEALLARNDGRAVEVDPGEHVFRFKTPSGKVLEQRLVIQEGDRRRKLVVDFTAVAAKPAGPGDAAEPASHSSIPTSAYALGGIGLAAASAGIFLDVTGKNRESDLKSTCAPSCAQSDVDSMRRQVLIGDVLIGVGVIGIGAAVWLALSSPHSTAWVTVAPTARGSALVGGARF